MTQEPAQEGEDPFHKGGHGHHGKHGPLRKVLTAICTVIMIDFLTGGASGGVCRPGCMRMGFGGLGFGVGGLALNRKGTEKVRR